MDNSINLYTIISDKVQELQENQFLELNLGFVWTHRGYVRIPFYPDQNDNVWSSTLGFSYTLKKLLRTIGQIEGISNFNLDLISCQDFYDYKIYNNYINGNIRYSVNDIGNASLSGSWVLSSDQLNLIGLYFSNDILQWNHILDGNDITSSAMNNEIDGIRYTKKTFYLEKNIVWNSNTDGTDINYINLTNGQTFDGQNFTIKFQRSKLNEGILNVNNSKKRHHVKVKNINIESDITTNSSNMGGGSLIRSQSYGFMIENCNSKGNVVGNGSGGLCGQNCNNFIILKSSFTGNINSENSGGICGYQCGYLTISDSDTGKNSNINIENCIFKGIINSQNSSGIAGKFFCYSTSNTISSTNPIVINRKNIGKITHCTSQCDINGQNSSGIVGFSCNSSLMNSSENITTNVFTSLKIQYCKYFGNINNQYCS